MTHETKAGDRVLVLTIEYQNGQIGRMLFTHETDLLWAQDRINEWGATTSRSVEPWDGVETVYCFGKGD